MISIVIATYNSSKTIQRCLDSIYKQDYFDYEILVKDGGSSDDTFEILKKQKEKFNFLQSSIDGGVYHAWNLCLAKAKGDWILFLGSDDYFVNASFLSKVQFYLDDGNNDNVKIVYGKNIILDLKGNYLSEVGEKWELAKKSINSHMSIRHPGCFHHISLFNQIGYFNEEYKIIGDYHYILRCLKVTNFKFYPFSGVYHSLGGISTNPSQVKKVLAETYKMRKELSLEPYLLLNKSNCKRYVIVFLVMILGNDLSKKVVSKIINFKSIFK